MSLTKKVKNVAFNMAHWLAFWISFEVGVVLDLINQPLWCSFAFCLVPWLQNLTKNKTKTKNRNKNLKNWRK